MKSIYMILAYLLFILYITSNKAINTEYSTADTVSTNPLLDDKVDVEAYSRLNESNNIYEQKTICSVLTGDIKASATAYTIKSRNEYLQQTTCNANKIYSNLNQLESRLIKEFEIIKFMLKNVIEWQSKNCNNCCQCDIETLTNKTFEVSYFKKNDKQITNQKEMIELSNYNLPKKLITLKLIKNVTQNIYSTTATLIGNRTDNLSKSQLDEEYLNEFIYDWKIKNFSKHLISQKKLHTQTIIYSPRFSMRGSTLQIRIIFQYLQRNFIYLQLLESSHPLQSDLINNKNQMANILLDISEIYKSTVTTEDAIHMYLFKYKISVVNQSNNSTYPDLVSQDFYNFESSGFVIPNSALLHTPYIKDGALLTRVFVYF